MNQDYIIITICFAIVAYTVRSVYKTIKNRNSSCGECGCSNAGGDGKNKKVRKVTLIENTKINE